jgi:molybdopterin molybdotransferase
MAAPEREQPEADVRMRGFARRTTVGHALAWIDAQLPPLDQLPTEVVPLSAAAGRVLARKVVAGCEIPRFARSMMDGFALRGEETHGASSYNRLAFQIVGESLPGRPFAGVVEPGQTVRIMTGAPLPAGADAVLPVELTEVAGVCVEALAEVPIGKNVGQPGEDLRTGDVVAMKGRILRPQDLGLLSSIGCDRVSVVRPPRVRLVITGNELLPAGTPPEGFRIADANGPMLEALVVRDGGALLPGGLIQDDPAAIRAALLEEADVILASGGTSVGREDYVPMLLSELGELAVHGVAMRPSSPSGMGRLGQALVFLLPGNPVSCLCSYDFFAGRAIRALGGRPTDWPYRAVRARLSRKLVSQVGRVDFARVQVRGDEAEPLAISGAAVLSSTTRADGFVIVPADSEGFPAGADVDVLLY